MRELHQSEIRQFYDDGYLILEGLFTRDEVAVLAESAERLRAVGRELAAALPAEDGEGETKVEHAGSQFVLEGNGSRRLQRVVWAGGCEPEFLACGRDVRLTSIVGQLFGSATAVHLLNQLHAKYPHDARAGAPADRPDTDPLGRFRAR